MAQTALPAGRLFPAAGEDTIARLEEFLAKAPSVLAQTYKRLIDSLDVHALARHRRPFASLSPSSRLELLEKHRLGSLPRRSALRALIAPLKIAHFGAPEFRQHIGFAPPLAGPASGRPHRDSLLPVADEAQPRFVVERSHDARQLGGDVELECDAVVIGTGAGGAVVARELAERGHAVVMIEEGDFFRRTDFTGQSFQMQARLYRDMGATIAFGNGAIPVPIGRTVGGTTTVNSGTCYRAPSRILAAWRNDGLTEFTDETMDRLYERVEQVIGVTPAGQHLVGGVGRVIARGCERLGYHRHGPLSRNAPDCDGQGVCCFGCPTDAKRSTNVSYVPMALKAGAELFYRARVERIECTGGRATSITASAGPLSLRVRARAVVVACGTLMTPVLLERSGLCSTSGQLGRNLSIHPAAGVLAEFDEDIAGDGHFIPQGYAIEQFHDQGLLFEGGSTPLELTMAALPYIGPRLVELGERFDRIAMFGFMIEDRSRGRVRSVGGRPLITYRLGATDVARLHRGIEILARVFLAAGAVRVMPMIHGFDELRSERDLAALRRARIKSSHFDLTAYHPLGTARMGTDPSHSVIGPNFEAHDVPGLYIADGAAVPSSLGVNPQVTIMALATRAAEHIDRALS